MLDVDVFKAYDVRGIYPDFIDEGGAYRIGKALVQLFYTCFGRTPRFAVGRDMRLSSLAMMNGYITGILDKGGDVVSLGEVATGMMYWAVGEYGFDGGIMVTASHNPAQYTGAKFVHAEAAPFTDEDLAELRTQVRHTAGSYRRGVHETIDIREPFYAALRARIQEKHFPLRVVLDGGNGMASTMIGPLLTETGAETHPFFWTPDGSFPDHEPNPLLPENRAFVMDKVHALKADLGLAWDGDADRCFCIDARGQFVDGDFLTALFAEAMLERYPGSTILYDVRASRVVADTVRRLGGQPLINRVGHTFFKSRMRETGAVFGGEVSGHYYFRDFYCADSGTLTALLALEQASKRPLHEQLDEMRSRYHISGEINSTVSDPKARITELAERFSDAQIS